MKKALWLCAGLLAIHADGAPTDVNTMTAVDATFGRGAFTEPVLVDLRTGQVRAIPSANWSRCAAGVAFRQIPLYDSPVLIAERATLPIMAQADGCN
jgi:hypothetical protein